MFSAAGLKRTWPTFLQGNQYGDVEALMMVVGAPRVTRQLADRRHISDFLSVSVEGEALRHLPNKYLAVIRGRGNDAVIVRVPFQGVSPTSSALNTGIECSRRTSLCPAQ